MATTTSREQIEVNEETDIEETDPMAAHIVDGKIVPCRWSELTEDEKRAAYCEMFNIY
jgi:hypothetical protein